MRILEKNCCEKQLLVKFLIGPWAGDVPVAQIYPLPSLSAQIPGAGCWPGSDSADPEGEWSSIPDRVSSSWVGCGVRCDVPTAPCWVRNHLQVGREPHPWGDPDL